MLISKFTPKVRCTVISNEGTDLYGLPRPGIRKAEKCSVVKLLVQNNKSSVRADSSASRGNAMEMEADGVFLMRLQAPVDIDDLIEIDNQRLRVVAMHVRYSVNGEKHHMEVHCTYWNEEEDQ